METVGDAIQQVLRGTGYQLVPVKQLMAPAQALMNKSLPVTQRHLGPLTVSDAINVLIGAPVYTLRVDPVDRLLSISVNKRYQRPHTHHAAVIVTHQPPISTPPPLHGNTPVAQSVERLPNKPPTVAVTYNANQELNLYHSPPINKCQAQSSKNVCK